MDIPAKLRLHLRAIEINYRIDSRYSFEEMIVVLVRDEKGSGLNGTGLRGKAQWVVQAKQDSSIQGISIVTLHFECQAMG